MNYLVLGAGKQGEAIAHDLLRGGKVLLVDNSKDRLSAAAKRLDGALTVPVDLSDANRIQELMYGCNAVVSAVPYDYNLALSEAAIAAGAHFVDLGGNNTVVGKQFALSEKAADVGVALVPDCGIAPGAVSVVAMHAIDAFGRTPEYVRIRVGGLPQEPRGPLNYMSVFSTHGLINEYKEPVEVLRNGRREIVEPLMGIETILFPAPFGALEAAYTSGGSSTLAQTLAGVVEELDYKTIRYPGHWTQMKLLMDLGLFEDTIERHGVSFPARAVTEAAIERAITYPGADALLLRVSVGDAAEDLSYTLIDRQDPVTGHTAMQRTTGYSAAIIAQMLASGVITDRGTLYQEKSVPRTAFLAEWKKRGMVLTEERTKK